MAKLSLIEGYIDDNPDDFGLPLAYSPYVIFSKNDDLNKKTDTFDTPYPRIDDCLDSELLPCRTSVYFSPRCVCGGSVAFSRTVRLMSVLVGREFEDYAVSPT